MLTVQAAVVANQHVLVPNYLPLGNLEKGLTVTMTVAVYAPAPPGPVGRGSYPFQGLL